MTHGTCTRVNFRGVMTEQHGWGTCVEFDNPLNYLFIDTFFNGKDEGGAMNQAVAGKTRSKFGVYLKGGWVPCEVRFVSCQAYHLDTVIYTTGAYEGLYISDCAFVGVGTGVDQVATTFDPDWPGSGGGANFSSRSPVDDCQGYTHECIVVPFHQTVLFKAASS